MSKAQLKTAGIAAAVAALVVWASNNVDFVEDLIG
jgi:hypothetical protein|tara:strand:+ start:1129 stop:1233 length:105 start_codon:yes stop_codon:yes gene_type:complete